jgi:hypothetical protein
MLGLAVLKVFAVRHVLLHIAVEFVWFLRRRYLAVRPFEQCPNVALTVDLAVPQVCLHPMRLHPLWLQ